MTALGQPITVAANLTPQALTLVGLPGAPIALANPFGDQAEAALQPFAASGEQHLLVTLSNGRSVIVWVLVPGRSTTTVGLRLAVDGGAEIMGERLKLSWRRYNAQGGFVIVSEFYQFSPRTRTYEKAPA
jgi:hypothetical protein